MAEKVGDKYRCTGCGELFTWDEGAEGSVWYGSILALENEGLKGIDVYCARSCASLCDSASPRGKG